MDSGVFSNLTYKFDGADLIYSLTPVGELYPIRLENLPLAAGPELDAKLHQRLPLYHGKVPTEGGLLESVRGALEDLLAAQGIKATVATLPFGSPGTHKVSAMSFSITAPAVHVGTLQITGVSDSMAAKVNVIGKHATGTPFDTANSAANLEHAFASFYADEGYAAVKVHAVRAGEPVISDAAVDIPFAVTIDEGKLYKLGAIHLPPDALLTQAELDKMTSAQTGPLKGVALRNIWGQISQRIRSKGYIDFKMTPLD